MARDAGSHPGSFETAHSLGRFAELIVNPTILDEAYDLIVVGAGISGLTAAFEYRKRFGNSRSENQRRLRTRSGYPQSESKLLSCIVTGQVFGDVHGIAAAIGVEVDWTDLICNLEGGTI